MSGSDARALSRSLLDLCRMRKLTIATAESCTGGLVAGALTDIPGSSDVIDRGFVTYSNDAKRAMLGVKATTLSTFGAVSKETATAMAIGALEKAGVDLAVSITGIAGPGGATPGKPVGLVHFAVASRDGKILHREFRFGAVGRTTVRQRSVVEALRMLMELARGPQPPVKPRRETMSRLRPRVSLSEATGVSASGLIVSSMIEGNPEATASSKARAKSSVRSTWAPKPPQARASAAKSGLARSVPETRPG
jgi:nicotinamide-nucleotide amidase